MVFQDEYTFIQKRKDVVTQPYPRARFSKALRWMIYAWLASACGTFLPILCAPNFRLIGFLMAVLVIALCFLEIRAVGRFPLAWRVVSCLAVPPVLVWLVLLGR